MVRLGKSSILVVLAAVAGLTTGACWYLLTKPQHEAERIMEVLRQVKVGQTSTEELSKIIESDAPTAQLHCTPDLVKLAHNPPVVGLPNMPMNPDKPAESNFYWPHLRYECAYDVVVRNTLLHRLRLAPASWLMADISTDDKVVTGIRFHSAVSVGSMDNCNVGSTKCDFDYLAAIEVGQALGPPCSGEPCCARPICVQHVHVTPPGFLGLRISLSSSVPISERNRFCRSMLPAFPSSEAVSVGMISCPSPN